MTQTERHFNASAKSKVIKYSELLKKLDALYESELSLAEKMYVCLIDPISSWMAAAAYAFASDKGKAPADLWRGEDNAAYISANTFYAQKSYELDFAFNKRISQKTWALGERAFEECQDYADSAALRRAKQVF